jgi:hypothetical protein
MRSYLLYIILWAGGCLIALFITLLWKNSSSQNDTVLFRDTTVALKMSDISGDIVNELLLSVNELNIAGSSTLISPGFIKSIMDEQSSNASGKKHTEKVYDAILLRKLAKVKRKSPSGEFAVKPVPEK